MKEIIAQLIHTCRGYGYETAGMIICFFDDAQQAQRCALLIRSRSGRPTEVYGSQLSVFL